MTLDADVQAIVDALDTKLEAKMDAVRQDLRNEMAGITGQAAVIIADQIAQGGLTRALQPVLAAVQSAHDGVDATYNQVKALRQGGVAQSFSLLEGDVSRIAYAVMSALLAQDETDESRKGYGLLPLTLGNRFQNFVLYALWAAQTSESFQRDVVATLDRATAPEAP